MRASSNRAGPSWGTWGEPPDGLRSASCAVQRHRRPNYDLAICLLQSGWPWFRSRGQGGPDQVEELLVADAGRVVGPQLEGALAGHQLGMAGAEAAVAVLLPAIDR